MPAYISLITLTDQGIKGAKDTVNRARQVEKAIEAVGGRKIGVWWTLGQYDLVYITEGPDDETVMRTLIAIGMQGNTKTVTLRAFSEDEMERIVGGLP